MGNRVTIKDVAREANVSIKTVSNVLNDTGSMRPDTRRRVEEVMRKLGYTVNISARAMRSGGTKLIGLNIFDFSQPFVPFFTDKVIEYAKERHYGVVINTYGSDGEGLVASVDESYRLGAEGWILFVMSPLADEGAVLEQPYPIVTTGDHLAYGKSDWITMPNIESISTVVGRFLDEGAQTVALMGVLPELVDEAVLRRQTEGTQRSMVQIHAPLPIDRRSHYRNGGFLYIPWLLLALSSHPAKPSTGRRRNRPPRKFRQWSNRPCSEASTPSIAARAPLP